MRIHRLPIQAVRQTKKFVRDSGYRRIARKHQFGQYRRIYLYHIRKTGGTSVVKMFLALTGESGDDVFVDLLDAQPRQLVKNGYVFAGWQKPVIEEGNYCFAFSHIPMHELSLPKDTFTLTCFRDPVARLISHYQMLLDMSQLEIKHPCFEIEGDWLGDSFDHFLDHIPRVHLQNQLFMFSRDFDIDEAVDRVKKIDLVMHLDRFEDGIRQLKLLTGHNLVTQHSRKSAAKFEPTDGIRKRLREMLDPEYLFLQRLRHLEPQRVAS